MLAASRNTFPLTEMEGVIPRAQNACWVMCDLSFEGQQSLMISLIITKIIGGPSSVNKNNRSGLEIN